MKTSISTPASALIRSHVLAKPLDHHVLKRFVDHAVHATPPAIFLYRTHGQYQPIPTILPPNRIAGSIRRTPKRGRATLGVEFLPERRPGFPAESHTVESPFILPYRSSMPTPASKGAGQPRLSPTMKTVEILLEQCILLSRWLLAPIYLALAAVLVLFTVKAFQEVVHLFVIITTASEVDLILSVLALVDMALVANLLVMVILSSYETFVSNLDVAEGQEKPSWLGKIDAATLKIKLAVAIVAISSIHLLKAFMTAGGGQDNVSLWNNQLFWLVVIHLTFVVSALGMAVVDKIAFAQHRSH
jgi:uncharacterized protein (TIGR00645 family)